MAAITLRLPDAMHRRIKELARARNISINKLYEEFAARAVSEFDAYVRFSTMAARGDPEQGKRILNKLARHYDRKRAKQK